MKAEEARLISEKFDNSLTSILFTIKCVAENGSIRATFDKEYQYIGDKEILELQKLGYKILKNNHKYLIVGW